MKGKRRLLTYTISSDDDGISLRKFLQGKGYSLNMLIRLKREGLAVNGGFRRLIDPVRAGDVVTVACPEESRNLLPNGGLAVPVLYDDEDLVVFDKPKDMLVHPAAFGLDDAMGNYFAYLFPDALFRPVGRLDRNTTGIALVAKHQLVAVALSSGALQKTYYAVAEGEIGGEGGSIDQPLRRIPGDKIRREVHPEGRRALTHYQVIARLPGHTLLSVRLETGRTHQIRAHFAAKGHPLAGDSLYGGSSGFIDRQALHCGSLSFSHPVMERPLTVISPLPEDMAALLKALDRNFTLGESDAERF